MTFANVMQDEATFHSLKCSVKMSCCH